MSFERRKVRIGKVVGDKMEKSVVVQVEWQRRHRLYKKSIRQRSRFKVHDAQNACKIGDLVRIIETRPISKFKRWRVDEILSRQEIAELQPEDVQSQEIADVLVENKAMRVEPEAEKPTTKKKITAETEKTTQEKPTTKKKIESKDQEEKG